MRQARVRFDKPCKFHCTSRTLDNKFLFRNEPEKDVFVDLMWRVADFCGIHILESTIMSNHFHIVLDEGKKRKVSDQVFRQRMRASFVQLHEIRTCLFASVFAAWVICRSG